MALSFQSSGQDGGIPVVIFVGSCKTLISARSELVIWNGESITGGPRSTLKTGGGGGMLIGDDGNGTSVAGSLLMSPSLASGDAVLLMSCELRRMVSGSRELRRLDAWLPLLRKTFDTLPRPGWCERRLRFWRRDAMADFEVDEPSRADCLLGVVHMKDEVFEQSESAADVLRRSSVVRQSL